MYFAIQQLLAEGEGAFDTLIEHFDDKRYSASYSTINGSANRTVGGTCRLIMLEGIECYRNRLFLITADQKNVFSGRQRELDLAKWWKANRNHPLPELQIRVIDQQVGFMKSATRDRTSAPLHPLSKEKLSDEEFEGLRSRNLDALEAMKTAVQSLGQPIRPTELDSQHSTMILLPWPVERKDR